MIKTYVRLDGPRIIEILKTDSIPEDPSWVDVGDWVGTKERPAAGYTAFLIDGKIIWTDTRIDEDFWQIVRAKRDKLLAETDWLVTRAVETGNPMPTGWATYRQELRDVTNQVDPREIIWPDQPT